jgi:hypothetical protein
MFILVCMVHFFSLKFALGFVVVQSILGIKLGGTNGT